MRESERGRERDDTLNLNKSLPFLPCVQYCAFLAREVRITAMRGNYISRHSPQYYTTNQSESKSARVTPQTRTPGRPQNANTDIRSAKVIYWHLIMAAIYNLFQASFFINSDRRTAESNGRQVDSGGRRGAIPKRGLLRESCARNGGRIPQGLNTDTFGLRLSSRSPSLAPLRPPP